MEALKNWAVSICFAGIAAAVAQMLFPAGSMQKVFRIAVSAFFLCCFVSPLLSIGPSLELSIPEIRGEADSTAEALEQEIERQLQASVEAKVKSLIEDAIAAQKIKPQKIIVRMDTGEDGGIVMKQVTIVLEKKDVQSSLAVKGAVQNALGAACPVEVKTG
ncbi:MAG: hypothetical protein HFE85_01485 [Clostridiales bacterium]|nr:hypothetical protein [Clostridiales bacterium]